MMFKGEFHKVKSTIGPGGWKCWCCAPKDSKARKVLKRLEKRRYHRIVEQRVKESLGEM